MSLINDALRAADRERASKSSTTKGPAPIVEGFLPYASSVPAPRQRSRTPLVIASSLAIVVLASIGWMMYSGSSEAPKVAPIILPPPVTMAQNPPATESPAPDSTVSTLSPTDQPSATAPERAAPSAIREQGQRPARDVAQPSAQQPQTGRERVVDLTAQLPVTPRIDYEAQATTLFNAGDFAGAKEKFIAATRQAPTARTWTNYGVTLQRLGDLNGAVAAYQSAIGMDSNYLEAWLYQARVALELGDATRATPLLQRARSIDPRNSEVNVELARLEYGAANYGEARRFAEEALRTDAANVRANWYVAVSSDQLKDTDAAVRGYSAYLQYAGDARTDQSQFIGWARERLAVLRSKP